MQKTLLQLISVSLVLLAGCTNIHQIDRARLSKKIMQLEPLAHQQAFITEAHSIREGAAGGTGQSAGGGCGCN